MEVSSHANCDAYSYKSAVSLVLMFGLSLWHGGSKVPSSTFSNIIFCCNTACGVGIWVFLSV